ncbi:hypothetical protein MTR67_029957 [Solanum verrucosum]|uniref:Carboxypeptidase A inhibitor-like domain-containing protein n=1 Tax=Solanum verrucosum TaxID=315347 RepID=A0AAF0RA60_SOLVR|nr:hypothetical protein MTR67_029957 [Solanum verrucosum]
MAQKLTILFTFLLVVIAAHDNSFYSTKIHVMAQGVVLAMVNEDPICNKPCKTHDDCSGALFCQAVGGPRGHVVPGSARIFNKGVQNL